ncbi:putative conjugative transfer protein [Orientia chuto str. Dubai]|uniref:Putative conjugative transfer protein n=1 Tax=Orientia chuto str. Dubai TaxID=1359168 RepID=A0A0F3MNF9_9RICK|nr:putative conjugative transfer protein [Orientia chuto str. Dubai]
MVVSSNSYHEAYLKEWGCNEGIISPGEVERQIADMKVVSSDTEVLNKFFQNHVQFVKGSNVSSVFFPKKIEVEIVLVSGTFRYWFSDNKHIVVNKTYLLTYKRSYLLLLTGVKENEI